ncbi:MAG: DNA/RNA non-specific endonuclease [Bacteroidales bacterium]|nr:DNA/RNA non-specific endonuclease [Bacteroidales bacterium]
MKKSKKGRIFEIYNPIDMPLTRIYLTLFLLGVLLIPTDGLSQGHRGLGEPPLNKKLIELPAIGPDDVILVYQGFIVNYNTKWLIPNWVAYELTAEEVDGRIPRAKGFGMDMDYREKQAMREDYSNTGWDKGHMAPSADMKWSQTAMNESFYLTNICPQDRTLNGRDWHTLEKRVREWAIEYGVVWVVCGPYVLDNTYGTIGDQSVVVPDGFFKAILRKEGRKYTAIAFLLENSKKRQPIHDTVVSVDAVEALVGYDLFTNLRKHIEESVESRSNIRDWK